MTLVVEDGTGLANADAYISQADVTVYWGNRPTSAFAAAWTAASSTNKDSAIRVATAYLDANYKFRGTIATDAQALAWPRVNVYNERGTLLTGIVPPAVKNACAELAVRALSEDLMPDVDRSSFTESEKVGPIEIKYRSFAPSTKRYNYVSELLRSLGSTVQGDVTLVRS
jgi:hypothetical protein